MIIIYVLHVRAFSNVSPVNVSLVIHLRMYAFVVGFAPLHMGRSTGFKPVDKHIYIHIYRS